VNLEKIPVLVLGLLLAISFAAAADICNVPSPQYGTISEALLDEDCTTIMVNYTYDSQYAEATGNVDPELIAEGDPEFFPIKIARDGITIQCNAKWDAPEDRAVIRVPESHAGFVIEADNVTIKDCEITSKRPFEEEVTGDVGIVIVSREVLAGEIVPVRGATIENNWIYHLEEGIRLIYANESTIVDNVLWDIKEDNAPTGDQGRHGVAINLENSHNNTLVNNIIGLTWDGATSYTSGGRAYTTSGGLGILLTNSSGNTIDGGKVYYNQQQGIKLKESLRGAIGNNTIRNVDIYRNEQEGVLLVGSDGNTIERNIIHENGGEGIELMGSDNNTIDANLVYDNGYNRTDSIQILLTKGELALFYVDIDEYIKAVHNAQSPPTRFWLPQVKPEDLLGLGEVASTPDDTKITDDAPDLVAEVAGYEITDAQLYGTDEKGNPYTECQDSPNIPGLANDIIANLNADEEIGAGDGGADVNCVALTVDRIDLGGSENNTISSNAITMTQSFDTTATGIKLEYGENNKVINNLITNEDILSVGHWGFLDQGIVLLTDANDILFNAIERINYGLQRGGYEYRDDIKEIHKFKKLAAVNCVDSAHDEVGEDPPWKSTTPDRHYHDVEWDGTHPHPDDTSSNNGECLSPTQKIIIMEVFNESIDYIYREARVKGNQIELNFFDHNGIAIDIVNAESNWIRENLFYANINDAIRIWWQAPSNFGIVIEENDFKDNGAAIRNNDLEMTQAAGDNYSEDPSYGDISPEPSANAPYCEYNFESEEKRDDLDKPYQKKNIAIFWWGGLPPNVAFLPDGVTLPEEKPRHCAQIFLPPECGTYTYSYKQGWAMVGVPVEPTDPDPDAVYGDDVSPLYIYEYETASSYVPPTAISLVGGYWLYLWDETTVDVTGCEAEDDVSRVLTAAGWHMVSPPWPRRWKDSDPDNVGVRFTGDCDGSGTVEADEQNLTPEEAAAAGCITNVLWTYDQDQRTYVDAKAAGMWPWDGYWVKTEVDNVTITFIYDAPAPLPPPPSGSGLAVTVTETEAEAELPLPPPPPPVPTPRFTPEMVDVIATPNPVVSTHTTTFKVVGEGAMLVEGLKIEIFDLSGRRVWLGEAPGRELRWHTEDMSGNYVANGVYLYVASVKVGGEYIKTAVKKIVVLRRE